MCLCVCVVVYGYWTSKVSEDLEQFINFSPSHFLIGLHQKGNSIILPFLDLYSVFWFPFPLVLLQAIAHYEQAADYYKGEESNSSANKCLLKVGAYAAQLEQYAKAIEIYEQVCVCMSPRHACGCTCVWTETDLYINGFPMR